MTSTMPFRLRILQQDLISDADQGSEGLDVQCRTSEQRLEFASGQIVHTVGGVQQAFNDVGHRKVLRCGSKPSTSGFVGDLPYIIGFVLVALALAALKAGVLA